MGIIMQDTSEDHTECEGRVMARESSSRLLQLLYEHHDFNMRAPRGWKKREPRIEVAAPEIPSAEFKELWFGFNSEETRPPKRELKIDEIKRIVCLYFDLNNTQLVGNRRSLETVRPRQIAAYFARNLTGKSLPEIGRRLGGRDHTTIMSACRRIEALMPKEWILAYDVAHLEIILDETSSYSRSAASAQTAGSISQSNSSSGSHSIGVQTLHAAGRT